jgi:antitoxin component YwqK of YwqJK toxin-antitoxin module
MIKQNKDQSKVKKWYKNENIKESSVYKNDKINGIRKLFYSNGEVRSISRFKNGRLDGLSEFFYYDGVIKRRVQYKNHKKNGICLFYYHTIDGSPNLYKELFYVNNRLQGIFKTYHENGQLMEMGLYKNDKEYGEYKKYDEHGRFVSEWDYVKGKLHGQCRNYLAGRIISKINVCYGINHGESIEYYEMSEQVKYITYFKHGKQHGPMVRYDKEGKVMFSSIYSNGEIESTTQYNPDQSILEIIHYKHDERLLNNDQKHKHT